MRPEDSIAAEIHERRARDYEEALVKATRLTDQQLIERLNGFSKGTIRVANVARAVGGVLVEDFRKNPWKAIVALNPLPASTLWVPALMFVHYALSGDPQHKEWLGRVREAARGELTLTGGESSLRGVIRPVENSPGTYEVDGVQLVRTLAAEFFNTIRSALRRQPAVGDRPGAAPPAARGDPPARAPGQP